MRPLKNRNQSEGLFFCLRRKSNEIIATCLAYAEDITNNTPNPRWKMGDMVKIRRKKNWVKVSSCPIHSCVPFCSTKKQTVGNRMANGVPTAVSKMKKTLFRFTLARRTHAIGIHGDGVFARRAKKKGPMKPWTSPRLPNKRKM